MIQRIQTVYLSLTTLISVLFLNGGFINFSDDSGTVINFTLNGISGVSEPHLQTLPVTLLIIIIPVLSLITIFLFKNRRLQLILCKTLLALISAFVLLLVFYSYIVISRYNTELVPGVKMAIPVIQFILSYLAYRGIKKDDDLVKSYDRLR
jgi:glucan phosphoethanolaminetransferase (alkaline phosphatase superfamily)